MATSLPMPPSPELRRRPRKTTAQKNYLANTKRKDIMTTLLKCVLLQTNVYGARRDSQEEATNYDDNHIHSSTTRHPPDHDNSGAEPPLSRLWNRQTISGGLTMRYLAV